MTTRERLALTKLSTLTVAEATATVHTIPDLQADLAAFPELADLQAVTRQSDATPARVSMWQAAAKDLLAGADAAPPKPTLTPENYAPFRTPTDTK